MKSSKDNILNLIRNNKPKGNHPYPKINIASQNQQPLQEEFEKNLLVGAGTFHSLKNLEEAEQLIKQLHPEAKVICSATSEIKGNKDLTKVEDPHDLADVDVGIIRAEFGVAENGMVWITEKDLKINALGFLSQHLIILLKPDQLVRNMHEAYKRIDLNSTNYGCFMYGPSATGDIAAVMVRGAQGARSLAVFFI